MQKRRASEAKKEYRKPRLTVYGTVQKLTQSVGHHGTKDGGKAPIIRTRV